MKQNRIKKVQKSVRNLRFFQEIKIGIMVTPVKKVPIHLQSSQNRIIIKNGTVVNHDKEEQMDIYIEVRLVYLVQCLP